VSHVIEAVLEAKLDAAERERDEALAALRWYGLAKRHEFEDDDGERARAVLRKLGGGE
jgi:hypothetical protein